MCVCVSPGNMHRLVVRNLQMDGLIATIPTVRNKKAKVLAWHSSVCVVRCSHHVWRANYLHFGNMTRQSNSHQIKQILEHALFIFMDCKHNLKYWMVCLFVCMGRERCWKAVWILVQGNECVFTAGTVLTHQEEPDWAAVQGFPQIHWLTQAVWLVPDKRQYLLDSERPTAVSSLVVISFHFSYTCKLKSPQCHWNVLCLHWCD